MLDDDDQSRLVISHLILRRVIGVMGVLLPVLIAVGCLTLGRCTELETSISSYYGTEMRDVFVGILFVIAWFLYAYRGYEPIDNRAGHIACACALGVALFPTTSSSGFISTLHLVFAACLFLTLAFFSIVLFTKTTEGVEPTLAKKRRNKVYRVCGVIMLACVALIPVCNIFFEDTTLTDMKPVFWLESLALWAFGFSWITKGEWLLADR